MKFSDHAVKFRVVILRNRLILRRSFRGVFGHTLENNAPSRTMVHHAAVYTSGMADEIPDQAKDCKACDIVFNVFMALGVVAVAFLAWDTMSGGKGTELLAGLFAKARPALAQVIPMEAHGDDADSA